MTSAQVVETSVTVNNNRPIQDYVHPEDQTQPTFEMTPGFKPFTVILSEIVVNRNRNKQHGSKSTDVGLLYHKYFPIILGENLLRFMNL